MRCLSKGHNHEALKYMALVRTRRVLLSTAPDGKRSLILSWVSEETQSLILALDSSGVPAKSTGRRPAP